ncbi:Uncharacterised protein [Mycobacterium tuberculosis]|nr:Uncharacterised protein [Mycobacterium tuberculosis]
MPGRFSDCLPFHRVEVAVADDPQLLLATQVIADVAVKDIAWPAVLRILDAKEDRHRVATPPAKDLAAFLA